MALSDDSRKKLKAILSTKLVETVGSCENELPDYIISMIINNKTKEYMRDNLAIFMGEEADSFSDWLTDLKDRLLRELPQAVQTSVKIEVKTELGFEAKVDVKRANTPEREVKSERRRDESAEKRKRRDDDWDHRSPSTISRDRRDERRRGSPDCRDHRSHRSSRRESPVRQRRDRSRSRSAERPRDRSEKREDKKYSSSTLDSPKATVRSSVVAKNGEKNDAGKTDRPSKLFGTAFMKAIAEASRVAKEKTNNIKEEEVRVDVAEKSRDEEKSTLHSNSESIGPSVTVRLNSEFKVPAKRVSDEASPRAAQKRKIVLDNDLDSDEASPVKKEKPNAVPIAQRLSKPTAFQKAPKVPKEENIEQAEDEATIDAFVAARKLEVAMALKMAKGFTDFAREEDGMDIKEEDDDEFMEDVQEEFTKAKTRCVFWPACRNGDECEFAHPSVACMNFPYCDYGQNCLYIHPPCRYGAGCLNSNCGAVHGAPETIELVCKLLGIEPPKKPEPANDIKQEEDAESAVDSALESPYASIPCRFRSLCRNPTCGYKHPAECRYGRDCQMSMCSFRHPDGKKPASAFPDAAKYKWKAPSAAQKNL